MNGDLLDELGSKALAAEEVRAAVERLRQALPGLIDSGCVVTAWSFDKAL